MSACDPGRPRRAGPETRAISSPCRPAGAFGAAGVGGDLRLSAAAAVPSRPRRLRLRGARGGRRGLRRRRRRRPSGRPPAWPASTRPSFGGGRCGAAAGLGFVGVAAAAPRLGRLRAVAAAAPRLGRLRRPSRRAPSTAAGFAAPGSSASTPAPWRPRATRTSASRPAWPRRASWPRCRPSASRGRRSRRRSSTPCRAFGFAAAAFAFVAVPPSASRALGFAVADFGAFFAPAFGVARGSCRQRACAPCASSSARRAPVLVPPAAAWAPGSRSVVSGVRPRGRGGSGRSPRRRPCAHARRRR